MQQVPATSLATINSCKLPHLSMTNALNATFRLNTELALSQDKCLYMKLLSSTDTYTYSINMCGHAHLETQLIKQYSCVKVLVPNCMPGTMTHIFMYPYTSIMYTALVCHKIRIKLKKKKKCLSSQKC